MKGPQPRSLGLFVGSSDHIDPSIKQPEIWGVSPTGLEEPYGLKNSHHQAFIIARSRTERDGLLTPDGVHAPHGTLAKSGHPDPMIEKQVVPGKTAQEQEQDRISAGDATLGIILSLGSGSTRAAARTRRQLARVTATSTTKLIVPRKPVSPMRPTGYELWKR